MTKDELKRVKEAVEQAELQTSGEIRVKIVSGLTKGVRTPHDQALREFYREGMDKTGDQTGVLILLVLELHAIEVLGDKGINDKMSPGTWDSVVQKMSEGIRAGKRCGAICDAILTIGKLLADNFPRSADDADELANEVIVGSGSEEKT